MQISVNLIEKQFLKTLFYSFADLKLYYTKYINIIYHKSYVKR